VTVRAHRVTYVPRDVVRSHGEASDEAACVVAGVAAFGDLDGVGLVAHGIENRLLGEARREAVEARGLDEA
jgi:hypothetical protein